MSRSITFLSDNPPLKHKGSGISVLLYNILCALDQSYKLNLITFCQAAGASAAEIVNENDKVDILVADRSLEKFYPMLRFGILQRTAKWVSFILSIPKILRRYNRSDNVFITVVGASIMPVCKAMILMKLAGRAKHGLYIVDDLELLNQKQGNRFELFLIGIFLKRTIQKSDLLINISQGLKELYLDKYNKDSIVLPPHFAKRAQLDPKESKKEFKFLYTGGLNLLYNDSLRFFASVIDRMNDSGGYQFTYKLVIQTYSDKAVFNELNFPLAHVVYSTNENRSELIKVYEQCECFLVPYSFAEEDLGIVVTSFPQKIAEIIQYGRKILVFGPDYSSVNGFFKLNGLSYICNEKSVEALSIAIKNISEGYFDVRTYLEAYENNLSAAAIVKVFQRLNEQLDK
ncbi:glycosyltransferase family protein [Pedobacter metabolipauper]|uniref:hypothetical protein n=1 Tax=Pedobacter metabolipauper TaxID=425513 RepID=UPI00105E9FB7|nr:hypothetical protein [Pedobacter metabolipauper]